MIELDRTEILALLDGVGRLLEDRRRQSIPDAHPDSQFLLNLRSKLEKELCA